MSTISVNTVKQFSGTSVTVASNLKVSGSTEMSGNVIVGNATSDTIKFNSVVSSSVVPHTHNAFNLGSSAKKWANIYVQTMNIQQVNNPSGSVVLSGSATGSCGSGTEAIKLNGATQVKGCLYVSGTAEVVNGLTIGGNLVVNGTTTTFNSTTVTVDDPIITLGGDTAPGSDDNKDRGIEFRYYTDGAAKLGFFGYDASKGLLTFIPDATNSSEVFTGTVGSLDIAGINTDEHISLDAGSAKSIFFRADGTTAMTLDAENKRLGINRSPSTYTLEVEGPVWINSKIYANGQELVLGTNNSTPQTSLTGTDTEISVKVANQIQFSVTDGAITPTTDNDLSLGSATHRFANIYTNDLHLANERGDWTIIEEEEYLSIRNNKSGKLFKFVLQEIE